MDLLHGFLEEFPVFGMLNGMEGGPQKLDIVFFQHTRIGELHGHIQAHLTAQRGQQGIGAFFLDDLRHEGQSDRFDIDAVSDIRIGHDGGRVAVHQNDFDAFLAERPAGLRACIVKFGGLSDDNRTGTDDHNFFHIGINHWLRPPLLL